MSSKRDQRKKTHILFMIAGLVLVGIAVFFAWWAYSGNDEMVLNAAHLKSRQECEKQNDKDICRFVNDWSSVQSYRMTVSGTDGKTVLEVSGNNTHTKTSGANAYEMIAIDKTLYTKAGTVWYKQKQGIPYNMGKVKFNQPATSESSDGKTVYRLLGKEGCGNLLCFKYEIDPHDTSTRELIWFDDKEFKLRRTAVQSKTANYTGWFAYDNISVTTPTPVKDMPVGKYIAPGKSGLQSTSALSKK